MGGVVEEDEDSFSGLVLGGSAFTDFAFCTGDDTLFEFAGVDDDDSLDFDGLLILPLSSSLVVH